MMRSTCKQRTNCDISLVGFWVQADPSDQSASQLKEDRFCESVGRALGGETITVKADWFTCLLARFVLGVDPSSSEIIGVLAERLLEWGVQDEGIALEILESMPRLTTAKRVFELFPLSHLHAELDVAIWAGRPSEAMEQVIGLAYAKGQSTSARLQGVGALCSECATDLVRGGCELSLACRGSRAHAGIHGIHDEEIIHAMALADGSALGFGGNSA